MLLESLSSDARYIVQSTARSGWRLRIDLRGTSAAGSASRHLAVCDFHGKWLRCDLNAQSFEGQGADVEELINVFRNWVDTQSSVLAPAFVS